MLRPLPHAKSRERLRSLRERDLGQILRILGADDTHQKGTHTPLVRVKKRSESG